MTDMSILAFTTPGPSEWMFILIIVLVLFGAKKLPELARSLGQSMNEFRKAREDFDRELQAAGKDLKPPPAQPYQAPPQQVPAASVPVQPVVPPVAQTAVPAAGVPPVQPAGQPATQPVDAPAPGQQS